MAASNTEDGVRKRMLTGCMMFAPVLEALDIMVCRFFFEEIVLRTRPLIRQVFARNICGLKTLGLAAQSRSSFESRASTISSALSNF